jgi:hypothetical protein
MKLDRTDNDAQLKAVALTMAVVCVRNTHLETQHLTGDAETQSKSLQTATGLLYPHEWHESERSAEIDCSIESYKAFKSIDRSRDDAE